MKVHNEKAQSVSVSIVTAINQVIALMSRIPNDAIALLARISIGAIFWRSGATKVNGFSLSENAIELFREDYKLPLIDPVVAATLAALAEHIFPVLLIVGLASRLSATALLGMTAIIQFFVYPGAWPIHGVWATALLVIIARGPGLISLDALIAKRMRP
jgi:putative oxidoreductase